MAAKKKSSGHRSPPNAGKGRPLGSKNKLPIELKQMVLNTLEKAGGESYLLKQAKKRNPGAFLKLVGQCLPKDVKIAAPLSMKIKLIPRGKAA